MSMHFTDVPNLLVVSPRDTIRRDVQINVIPLPVDLISALENRIETEQDVSALILPLGGMALYPAMVLETSNLNWAIETFAHEWVHHYLYFFPLGLQYLNGETYIINETTADVFGKEVWQLVAARYYPELIAETVQISPSLNPASCRDEACLVRRPRPLLTPSLVSWGGDNQTTTPPPFDFGATMNETRVTVDALLAEGKVDEAEIYMEERRRIFVANGYPIRRLNQAYFAFYGGYQGGSAPGAAGEDPIGPAVRAVRESSPNLHDFVVTMRTITTRDELVAQASQ
jgi:hypothetical protein